MYGPSIRVRSLTRGSAHELRGTLTGAAPAGLTASLRRRIAAFGPLTVAEYMAAVLTDPEHGYYVARQPFGREGDFITAPEVSQMFGELLGAWAAHTWDAIGAPNPVRLVELGPGRGTLMADALRAARHQPGFAAAASVYLVEVSPRLRQNQKERLADSGFAVEWHGAFADVRPGPVIAIANELFDALPIRQFERTTRGWCERLVDADGGGGFRYVLSASTSPAATLLPTEVRGAPLGAVAEVCPAGLSLAAEIAGRIVADGGAALVIDYGATGFGPRETLQAVARHKPHPPLESPGMADLCAHVDFAMLGRAAAEAGAKVWGPVPQGAFLEALGVRARAEALKAEATADQAGEVDAALARLVGTEGMGGLFQVLCIAAPGLAAPAGFGS